MDKREHRRRIAETVTIARDVIEEIWGTPMGLALVEAFYRDDGWVTARGLAEREQMSDDTVRRELERLLERGCVEMETRGRTHFYRAKIEHARESVDRIGLAMLKLATDLLRSEL